jgi:uncharacterized protein YdaU (DUF1376 family)
MKRPKIPDMPVELIALHPRATFLPPAAFGMLCRLVFHHWITEKPIPQSDQGVQAIIVTHKPTWRAHKDEIREILADVIPTIERRREIKRETNARLSAMSEIGKGARRYNTRLARQAADKQIAARAITLPERTQTQAQINIEKRTKRHNQNVFVETHL